MILYHFKVCFVFIFCSYFPFLVFPAQRSSFSTCCKTGLMMLNYLSFCLLVKILTSPTNPNESYWVEYSWLQFLHFHNFKCIMPFPLACRVSVEKSADSLMGVPLHVICHFFLVAFSILSLSLIFVSLITMCLGVFLLGFILPGTLCASWTWLTSWT